MIELIASAFVDEIASIQLEKLAANFDEAGHNRITGAVAKRMRDAGMNQAYIDAALFGEGGMSSELQRLRESAGAQGSAAHEGAKERVRQLTREYSSMAPRKTMPQSWLGAQVAKIKGDPDPYKSHRITPQKPRLSSELGNRVRDAVGLEPKPEYAGAGKIDSNIRQLIPEDSRKLQKSLTTSGEKIIGAKALKDVKSGTGKGIAEAARKTLLPALRSMPTPLKIAGGIGAGVLGKKVLFGDDSNKTTITVG